MTQRVSSHVSVWGGVSCVCVCMCLSLCVYVLCVGGLSPTYESNFRKRADRACRCSSWTVYNPPAI